MADIETVVVQGESIASDPVEAFSFESAHAKAMEMFGADDTPEAVTPPAEQVETAPAPDATGEEEATNVDNASAAQLAQLSDDQLVEVTVDGETVQMPWKDARAGVMRQAHYTKNMQALRAEQQQFEAQKATLSQAQQEREALVKLLQSEDLMKQFLTKQYPQLLQQAQEIQKAQTQADPEDIATVGQIQQAQQAYAAQIAKLQEQFQQQAEAQLEKVTQTIEDRQATAKLAEGINHTISEIFTEHPYLQRLIPDAEQVLRYNVLRLNPTTPEETLAAFKQVADGWVENYKAEVAAANKQSVINKQKLVTNNIQPPGGAPIQPQPTSYKKTNPMTGKTEVDFDALRKVAEGMLGD